MNKNTARCFVAKYIPNMQRFEPRNVGVIVWFQGQAAARFAAEKSGRSRKVDGRSVPSFIADAENYARWVSYWRSILTDPAALTAANKGNFAIVESGYLLDSISVPELQDVADDLYERLVKSPEEEATEPKATPQGKGVLKPIKRKLQAANIIFRSEFPVRWERGKAKGEFFFDMRIEADSCVNYLHALALDKEHVGVAVNEASGIAFAADRVLNNGHRKSIGLGVVIAYPRDPAGNEHLGLVQDVLAEAGVPTVDPHLFEVSAVMRPLRVSA